MNRMMLSAMVPGLLVGACGDGVSNGNAAVAAPSPRAAAVLQATPAAQPTPVAASATPVGRQDEATFLITLRDRLIAVGAKLDGAPVTGLRAAGRCAATMTTGEGATTFRWADIGDLAANEAGGVTTLPLMADGRAHPLTMPVGDGADGISGALGMLEMDCQGS